MNPQYYYIQVTSPNLHNLTFYKGFMYTAYTYYRSISMQFHGIDPVSRDKIFIVDKANYDALQMSSRVQTATDINLSPNDPRYVPKTDGVFILPIVLDRGFGVARNCIAQTLSYPNLTPEEVPGPYTPVGDTTNQLGMPTNSFDIFVDVSQQLDPADDTIFVNPLPTRGGNLRIVAIANRNMTPGVPTDAIFMPEEIPAYSGIVTGAFIGLTGASLYDPGVLLDDLYQVTVAPPANQWLTDIGAGREVVITIRFTDGLTIKDISFPQVNL